MIRASDPPPADLLRSRRPWEWLLAPAAWAYGRIIDVRNKHYDRAGRVARVGVPVISVGNLTTGGTGKTPLVIHVVQMLAARGQRPAILTRGYRARPGEVADEVQEFAAAAPDAPVIVNPDRVRGAATAIAGGADVLVLDDGFQHRRLGRTLDIVTIDALNPLSNGWLLPAGRLREPVAALRRADIVVVTRMNQVAAARHARLAAYLAQACPAALLVRMAVRPVRLCVADGISVDDANGRRWLALSGIGNPATFTAALDELAVPVVARRVFGDHHRYTAGDVRHVVAAAEAVGAAGVVTTRKDWVKLRTLWPAAGALPLAWLEISTALDPARAFAARVEQAIRAAK